MRRAVRHLLVTDDDVMNEAERIVGHTLLRENQGDEGCLTVTEMCDRYQSLVTAQKRT